METQVERTPAGAGGRMTSGRPFARHGVHRLRPPEPARVRAFLGRHGGLLLAGVAGVALAAGWIGEEAVGLVPWVLAAYLVSYAAGSWYGVIEVWHTLRAGAVDINFLMLIAAAGAALIDQWHEGATLLFLFSLSNALQVYALGRTRRAIEALVALRPENARVVSGDTELQVAIDEVVPGTIIRLRPGERVPLDAIVTLGQTSVDESALTGESIPVDREPGATIRAGTMNLDGVIEARVERPASDSMLARVIRLVEEARGEKALAQQIIDRFGAWYTWIVLGGSLAVFLVLRNILGQPFDAAFYTTMVVLVVASPCALVISTPAAVLSGIARGAKLGILFKGGAHLEAIGGLRAVAFDKTGTLTVGRPVVVSLVPAASVGEEELLAIAASVERHSEHPLAEAIVTEAVRRGVEVRDAADVRAVPGHGIEGLLDGTPVRVGRPREEASGGAGGGIELPGELHAAFARLDADGVTTVAVEQGGRVIGLVGMADELRPGAAAALAALRQLGLAHLAMISGDSEAAAARVGRLVGVDIVRARVSPEAKVEEVRALRRRFDRVGMVGDGVNDAPALAAATVGIAMGTRGTDAALETADVVLMKDDLGRLAQAVELGRKTRLIVTQNLVFATLVIVVLVAASLGANLPLAWGVVGHEGSTVLVVLNSLRLLTYRPTAMVS